MYEYDFKTYSVRRKRSKKKIAFWILFLVCITLFFIFSPHKKNPEKQTLGNKTTVSEDANTDKQVGFITNPLGRTISEALVGTQGSYAIVVTNKKTGESYMHNEHTVYDAGSFYKLWIMATVYQQIEAGNLQEDVVLEGDIKELNKKFHIPEDSAELTEGTIDFSVASALKQMITISHNYAALLLTEKIRLSTVGRFLSQKGFKESHVGGNDKLPTTTASDIALFFDKLLKGELANEENTAKMLTLLEEQKLNNKLPRLLPTEVVVAHKTAELGLFSHDGGIVYLPDAKYIIVVMSKTNYPPGAEERISNISQNVYNYFTK